MPILLAILIMIAGVGLLLVGGELLVRGAVEIAQRIGVSALVIGLTVVAFGTSAPELALNIVAAINENTGLSFGNIVGSNIANIGLVLGIAAMIMPLRLNDSVVKRELPLMLGATLLACSLGAWEHVFGGSDGFVGFSRADGVVMLVCFVGVLTMTVVSALRDRAAVGPLAVEVETEMSQRTTKIGLGLAVMLFIGGLVLLIVGGRMTEAGASSIARTLGIADQIIGLTVVAVSTSLPELVTSVVAARRGHVDLAVGNILGSNIFNLLLVLGATALVAPVPLPGTVMDSTLSLGVMAFLSFLLLPFAYTHERHVQKSEGFVLLSIYVGYLLLQVIAAFH